MILFWVSKLCFCSSKQIKPLLLKAVWAENVFDEIIKTNDKHLVDHLFNYQLSETITKALEKYNVTPNDIEESRTEFMKKFDPFEGVKLPQSLLRMQERLFQAVNNSDNLTFYPNTITTPDIFRIEAEIMKGGIQYNRLTLGRPGISKTMSYVLSWALSSESIGYRYLYPKKTTQLIKQNVFRRKMSKIIYLSFRNSKANFLYFTQIILDQCPQVNQQVRSSIGQKIKQNMQVLDFSNVLGKISYLYSVKGIQCLVILDQINTLASILKKAHLILKDQNEKQKNKDVLQSAYILFKVYSNISVKFPKIFNSSSNIENQLQIYQTTDTPYALDINHHNRAKMHYLYFNEKSLDETKIKEIYRHIWYEAAKLIPQKHEKVNEIRELFIKNCDQLAKSEGYNSYITPLSIFTAFDKQKKILTEFYQNGKHKQKQFITKIYQKITSQGKQIQTTNLNKYFENASQQNIKNVLECWHYLYQNKQQVTVPASKLSASQQDIKNVFNKDWFRYQDKKLQLIISRKDFFEFYKKILDKIVKKFKFSILIDDIAERQDIYGVFIQMAVLKMMKSYKQFVFIIASDSYVSSNTMNFKNFLGKNSIYKKLEKIIEETKLKQKSFFCFPIKQSQQKNQKEQKVWQEQNEQQIEQASQVHSSNNPSFDFLHIKSNREEIQITSFDLTTVNQKPSIKNKLTKAQTLLQNKLNFLITVKDQFVEQNDFLQFLYESIRKEKNYERKLKAELQKKNDPQKIIKMKNKIQTNKNKLKNQVQQFCLNHLSNEKQLSDKLNNLVNNSDQLLVEIFKIYEMKGWGRKTKNIITKWDHIVVCRGEFKQTIIPQKKVINGVNISFKLSPIHQIKVQTEVIDTVLQYRNLLQRLLKKIEEKTKAKAKAKQEQEQEQKQKAKAKAKAKK